MQNAESDASDEDLPGQTSPLRLPGAGPTVLSVTCFGEGHLTTSLVADTVTPRPRHSLKQRSTAQRFPSCSAQPADSGVMPCSAASSCLSAGIVGTLISPDTICARRS